jgi:uroporphyrinogen decarboxylase
MRRLRLPEGSDHQRNGEDGMNTRLEKALNLEPSDRVPFLPAIYEHKAWFVGETPSKVCRDVNLFTTAALAEYERVQPDALTVGIDVYNVEAEAVGCKVTYYAGDDISIPAIGPEGAVFQGSDDVASLKMPDPKKDGRMPLNLEVARRVVRVLGREVPIRGAVSGPFSMASSLVGSEHVLMLTVTHPGLVKDLIAFSAEVIKRYGHAFRDAGCGVIMFDSQASPELLSPAMYRDFVLGPTQGIIKYFQQLGVQHVPLIIGGNTTLMLDAYLETGANNILCDAKADIGQFLEKCSKARRAFRRNLDTSDFLELTVKELRRRTIKMVKESKGYPGFILGTGVVPYGTPLANLIAIREVAQEVRSAKK